MAKRIKNNTGATITVLGQEIAAAAYYTFDQFDEQKAINTLDTEIDAGTIVVNDGVDDLSAALGKALINGWDAGSVGSVPIDTSNKGNGRQLQYNSTSKKFEYVDSGAAAAGAKGQIQVRGNSAGSFTASTSFTWDDVKQALTVGDTPGTLAGLLVSMLRNRNSYIQHVIQNSSAGTQASSDLVATNDTGADGTGYVDVGINSSGYSDPAYALSLANDSYVYANAGNLTVGTDTASMSLIFHTGGFGASNERLRFIDAAAAKDVIGKFSCNLRLYNDTTANRPTAPANGIIRYNTTTNKFEGYENGAWVDLRASNVRYLNVTMSDGTNSYISTVATGYAVLSKFIYTGSSDIGAITKIYATVSQANGATTSIRIYDVTNALVIAELTGFNDTTTTIKDLGAISNLPSGQAIFEIQAKTSNASKAVLVSSVQIKT